MPDGSMNETKELVMRLTVSDADSGHTGRLEGEVRGRGGKADQETLFPFLH